MAKYVDNKDISELVREAETNFISGTGTLTSKYVTSDLYDDINKIYAYLESAHWTGDTDSRGRDKPFFNIVNGIRNIWYRATDLDRKNVNVKATKISHTVPALLATIHLQEWMRREDFGSFLNKWGMDLASFNSSVVKFIKNEGKLHPMIVPWSRLIVDQVDFDSNPKIEILELTESQLRQRKGYNQDMVEKLCDALAARELTDTQDKDTKSDYIKLYEVHGNLPLSYLTGKESDTYKYEQQMHIISFVAKKETGQYDDFTLYAGREEKDPYILTSLLPNTDGSISLLGSVKTLFNAQWMINHTVKSIKDQLDIASKLLFQTSDTNYVNRNVLTAIESGDIMVHAINQPLTQLNNTSHDITAQESFGNMWKGLASEIAGVSESMLGNTAPSGTAWRQVEALLNESHSLFELMTENKALHLEKMIRTYVIPFLKEKMDTSDEIAATLEAHQISKIDAIYVPNAAVKRFNNRTIETVLSGGTPEQFDPILEQGAVQSDLGKLGNQRFFKPSEVPDKTWKEVFKDLEWDLEVDITGEQTDKQTVLTTLNTTLQVLANPTFSNNPRAQLVVDKILQQTGVISPIELSTLPNPPPAAPAGNVSSPLSTPNLTT